MLDIRSESYPQERGDEGAIAGTIGVYMEALKRLAKRREAKFIGGFFLILLVSAAVWYASWYFSPEARERRAVLEHFENLEEQYRTDTYGGETPEETLELFIEALEKEDIELASKYFLPDEREEIQKDLLKAKEEQGGFSTTIKRMESLESSTQKENRAFFVATDENNHVIHQVTLGRNKVTDVWKITDL